MLRLLRKCREDAELTQEDLADALGETQSWVSKVERGERRLDLVELRAFCKVIGVGLVRFVKDFEATYRS
jgi:transcriptional regulator with XRE-family HTH domain